MNSNEYCVGRWAVAKVWELDLNDFEATTLLPDIKPDDLAHSWAAMDQRTYDPASGKVSLSVHTWVLRDGEHTILIDAGAGNDKDRPKLKMLDHLQTQYLDRLAEAGVRPEEVDYVLLTHLHADHVGWNTRLVGGRWMPTFPNATVVCSDLEWRYGAALGADDEDGVRDARAEAGLGEPIRTPVDGVFADSIVPIGEADRLRRIAIGGSDLLDGVRFLSVPGHSIDHAAISVTSDGQEAIFGGDVFHHPLEISDPDLVSMFCEFPDAARRSRRLILEHAAQNAPLFFSSHLPASSVGRINRDGAGYRWQFLED